MAAKITSGRDPRTVLELLIWQQDHTYEELAAKFDQKARELGENTSISPRHLRRLASGERSGTTPVTRRVLQQLFGRPVDQLLRVWEGTDAGTLNQSASGLLIPGADTATDRGIINMAANRARHFSLSAGEIGLTPDTMDQLHEDIRDLAIAYPQRPLSDLLGDLVSVQDVVFSLLEQRQRPNQGRTLYFLAGVVGGLLAKASHDLAEPQAAMTQARTAFTCAENADHSGLRAWIRGLQSLIAYWAGRQNEAIRYAQQGTEFAEQARGTSAVWLPMNEARSWGALGNSQNASLAIQRAEDAWDRVQPDDMDSLGGIATFNRSRQLYYAADALSWGASDVEEAESYAARAVEAYTDPSTPDWAFGDQAGSHADLAVARLMRGEIEGAVEALDPVLVLPPEQRMNGIIKSVKRVHSALRALPSNSDAKELQERIEFFARTPMKALPH